MHTSMHMHTYMQTTYAVHLKRAISRTWFPQLWGLAGLKSLEQTKLRLGSGLGAGEGDEAAAHRQNSFFLRETSVLL